MPTALTIFVVAAAAVIEPKTWQLNDSHVMCTHLKWLRLPIGSRNQQSFKFQQQWLKQQGTTCSNTHFMSQQHFTAAVFSACSSSNLHKHGASNAATGCQPSNKKATDVGSSSCKQQLRTQRLVHCAEAATSVQKRAYLRLSQTVNALPAWQGSSARFAAEKVPVAQPVLWACSSRANMS